MPVQGSVTSWLEELHAGSEEAARKLWERFAPRLQELAQRWLKDTFAADFDEEDIALSGFHAFCRAITEGRYQAIANRKELWQVLTAITIRKAIDRIREKDTAKRGGRHRQAVDPGSSLKIFDQIAGNEPSPEFTALMADNCRQMLDELNDPELEAFVIWRLEGYSNSEIAERLGYSLRTINRMLHVVRKMWQDRLDAASGESDSSTSGRA